MISGLKVFYCDALDGVSERALKNISRHAVKNGDHANVNIGYQAFHFRYDTTGFDAEKTAEPPRVIRPTDYHSDVGGVWREVIHQSIVLYGTGDPPSASGLPDGTIYFKYE